MYASIGRQEHVSYSVAVEDRDLANLNHPPHNHVIRDEVAATIASWYHSPGACCTHLTALSHGMPFDVLALRDEVRSEVEPIDTADSHALLDWLMHIEITLLDSAE